MSKILRICNKKSHKFFEDLRVDLLVRDVSTIIIIYNFNIVIETVSRRAFVIPTVSASEASELVSNIWNLIFNGKYFDTKSKKFLSNINTEHTFIIIVDYV